MSVNNRELEITIGTDKVVVAQAETFPIAISYRLEDGDDWQSKRSAETFDLELPATLDNSKASNSFHDPNIEDTTALQVYRNPRPCKIVANGVEVFSGKALLQVGTETDRPEKYVYDCLGQNGDWLVDLQEKTLWDFVSSNTHFFVQSVVENSWNFNGTNENQDYVYAPVRYKSKFNNDMNVTMLHLRPSLFIWPFILRAFRSCGYTIKSGFIDTNYFRRMVMPWVWGNFLKIDSATADILKFLATGPNPDVTMGVQSVYRSEYSGGTGSGSEYIRNGAGTVNTNWRLDNTTTSPGFDNNKNYAHNLATGESTWTYNLYGAASFGTINARFLVSACGRAEASYNSDTSIYCEVYKNGSFQQTKGIFNTHAGATSTTEDGSDARTFTFTVKNLNPGDTVTIKFKAQYSVSRLGSGATLLIASQQRTNTDGTTKNVGTTWSLTGISIALGGIVDFKIYDKFKNFKILDLFKGLADCFDWIIQTDSVTKTVYIESAYDTILDDITGIVTPGYFSVAKKLNWQDKLDVSQPKENENYSDTEQVQFFKFKGDSSDGAVTKYESRWSITAAASKYLLPERFKTGKKDVENRFFSPVMHVRMTQWSDITASGLATQLIVLVPENISNTSSEEAENQLAPKLAWYKGLVPREEVGGWWWYPDPESPGTSVPDKPANTPYMFAVNYAPNGHRDPVLTYNDQKIGVDPSYQLGRGLLRRFFLQRMAIQEYGKRYSPFMNLNTSDVTNWLHREAIQIRGADYHLVAIENYKPLLPVSTKCTFWKYIPITQNNANNIYPSTLSTLTSPTPLGVNDLLYQPLFILKSDLK